MMASGPGDQAGAQAAGRPASTSEPAATSGAGSPGDAIPDDPQELAEDIERTREQLGETVEALTARLDAKAQARATAAQLKNRAAGVTARVADRVKTSPLRQQLAGKTENLTNAAAGGRANAARFTPEPARRATARAARTARERPLPYAAAAGAAAVLLIGWLAWRRRR
jgi:hypothetical protein